MAPQQFKAGVPVVIPGPFSFQCIDSISAGLPTAVVVDSALEGPSVTASYIADNTIDVEQQDAWRSQNV
jgi:hypothetical protein